MKVACKLWAVTIKLTNVPFDFRWTVRKVCSYEYGLQRRWYRATVNMEDSNTAAGEVVKLAILVLLRTAACLFGHAYRPVRQSRAPRVPRRTFHLLHHWQLPTTNYSTINYHYRVHIVNKIKRSLWHVVKCCCRNGRLFKTVRLLHRFFFNFTVFCKVLFQNVLCSKQNKNIALISTNKLDEFTYISPYQEDNLKKHFRRKKLKFPRFSLSDNL